MNRILAIAKRIWSQFAHDPRTLALLFVAPVIVLWLLSVLLVADTYEPKIAAVDLPEAFEKTLEEQDAHVMVTDSGEAMRMLEAGEVDAVVSMKPDSTTLDVLNEGTNSTKSGAVTKVVAEAVSNFGKESRAEIETYIDEKKAEIEARKTEIESKKAEIQERITEAKAAAGQQRRMAERKLDELKSSFSSYAENIAAIRSSLAELKEKLAPFAASNPEIAAALQSLSKVNLGGMSLPSVDLSGLSLDSSSLDGLMNDIDIDSMGFGDIDLDFSFDMADFMPVQEVQTEYLHGSSDWSMFDFLGPVFIALFLFAFVFITCSFSLVNERVAGTMERFLDTPVHPAQILGGYTIGFGAMSLVQAAVILLFGLCVIGFPNEGSIWLVILIALSLAITSVTMGLLVSGLASKSFQIVQLMLLFVVPQILLCGLFDLSASPEWLQVVSTCLPLTYGVDAMRQVMLAGAGFAEIWFDLAIVWAFILVFFILASLRFTKKRAKA